MRDDWYMTTPTTLTGQSASSVQLTAIAVPPARDDWYLETPTTRTGQSAVIAQPVVKPAPPTRDDWWLDVGDRQVASACRPPDPTAEAGASRQGDCR
jgi:hypothetical protein